MLQNSHFSNQIPSCSFLFDSRHFSADNHAETFCIKIAFRNEGLLFETRIRPEEEGNKLALMGTNSI